MSGEAGATLESELYSLFVGMGLRVSVAEPPGGDGNHTARYFERKNAPYLRWVAAAKPALDALFATFVAEGEPIVALAQKFEEVDGMYLDGGRDGDDHFRKYYQGGPLIVRLSAKKMPDAQSLNVTFVVSKRVAKARMQVLVERVATALVAVPIPPEPPQPIEMPEAVIIEPARSWWSRLFRR